MRHMRRDENRSKAQQQGGVWRRRSWLTAEALGLSWVQYLPQHSLALIKCRLLRLCPPDSQVLLLIYLIGLPGSSACPGVILGCQEPSRNGAAATEFPSAEIS